MIVPRLQTMVFLGAAVPVAAIGLAVLVAGWVLVTCLAITPLVVPALVAFRAAAGGIAWLDGQLANELLDTSVRPPVTSPGPGGFWRSGLNVLGDGAFWRQQAYLMIRLSLGFALGIAAWAVLAAGLGLLTLPAWYRFDNVLVLGRFVDTIGRALLGVPAGLAVLAVLYLALGPLRRGSQAIVVSLLAGPSETGMSPEALRRLHRRGLMLHAAGYATFNLFLIAVWALTGHSSFWPVWTLIVFGLPLGAHAVAELVESRSWPVPRSLVLHGGLAGVLAVFFTSIWAASSRGYFWPVWIFLVLGITLAVHAAVVLPRRSQERIAELEETRAGAVEQQGSELARIERDLHDGAQARLVALGMQIGLAEQKLQVSTRRAPYRKASRWRRGKERARALEELRDARSGNPTRRCSPTARARSGDLPRFAARTPAPGRREGRPPPPSVAGGRDGRLLRRRRGRSRTAAELTPGPEPSRSLSVSRDGNLVVEVSDDGVGGRRPRRERASRRPRAPRGRAARRPARGRPSPARRPEPSSGR